ncbi:MAG TPA: PilN domain-containing protein [Patescibacteria group bacterium]|nr:PilN domain-containing protein [Patescibacteria group bacterium]
MPKNSNINLLPQEEFDTSVVGRILKWAMGTFRIIVIITEMIVMAAFLSRFWLDAQNSDLNDTIKNRTAQISNQADFEKQFRGLQSKLNIVKLITQGTKSTEKIDAISSKLPSGIVLSTVSVQDSLGQVKGTAGSEIAIAQFISNLKSVPQFKEVNLSQVNSSENNPSLSIFTVNIIF